MVEYVFAPGSDNEIRLGDADIVQHNPVKIHTGKGDLRATVALDRRLDDAAKRQDRLDVRIDGEVKWTGFVVGVRHDVGGATTRIRADGIGKRLEETRPAPQRIDIKSKRLDEAIRDYWTRTPFDATVRDQIPEVVAEDELVQSAATTSEFQAITDLDPTDPVVIENGELRRGQSAYFFEGESEFISGSFTDPEYSDGGATGFDPSHRPLERRRQHVHDGRDEHGRGGRRLLHGRAPRRGSAHTRRIRVADDGLTDRGLHPAGGLRPATPRRPR